MNNISFNGAKAKGFTLIEIIAVIVIIGLMAAMISVSMGGKTAANPTRHEAQLFMQAADFVAEQAVLNGEVIGMFVELRDSEDSTAKQWCYRWQLFRDEAWHDLPEDSLSEHCLPDDMQWDLSIEGHLFAYEPELEVQLPALVWSPSGESTPLEMKFYENSSHVNAGTKSEVQHIEIDMMGNIEWLELNEENERRDAKPKKR
jgi:general secretion pathway protein H